jgi:hypothetical protein
VPFVNRRAWREDHRPQSMAGCVEISTLILISEIYVRFTQG